jgi:aquaporin Z
MSGMKIQPLVAEFLGTFFFCFAGIAAILSASPAVGSGAGIVGIALANGLALSVAVNAFGGISGAHFNPAVSVGFFITGRLALSSLGPYIAAQLLGATIAAFICRMLFPVEASSRLSWACPCPRSGPAGARSSWESLS